jgi:N-acetylglutamate synthase-like GNAT family acetyltransferase
MQYQRSVRWPKSRAALTNFLVGRDEHGVVGAVGLEVFESVALLRAPVVGDEMLADGLGNRFIF